VEQSEHKCEELEAADYHGIIITGNKTVILWGLYFTTKAEKNNENDSENTSSGAIKYR